MGNKLYKYFFNEFFRLFILILISLSLIVWVVQAVNYLDIVTEDGHAFNIYFIFSTLNLPKVISKLIPFSFMLGLFFTILKFDKNNELIIAWVNGINKISFVNLVLRIAILITLVQLILASSITPYTLNMGRSALKSSDIGLFPSLLKEKKFNDTVENLTVFIEEKKSNGELINIFLRDDTTKVDQSKTIIAKKGYVKKINSKNYLTLYDGTIQTEKQNGKINFIKFSKTEINLSSFATKTTTFAKLQERSSFLLFNCFNIFDNEKFLFFQITSKEWKCPDDKKEISRELNRRFGMPLYIPLISLIICYLFSTRQESKYYSFQKYLIFGFAFVIIVFAEIMVRYSVNSNINLLIYYFFPFCLILLIYINLIRKFKFENLLK